MEPLSEFEAVQRILLALAAGGVIGFERERSDKPAGLRTYALVCEGAALFMIASILLADQVRGMEGLEYDPSRIGSTIVQGIGFIAAGVIITAGGRVRGLTTAAGIWVTAAIGLLIGSGFYLIASVATVMTLVVLVALKRIERLLLSPLIGSGNRDTATLTDEEE